MAALIGDLISDPARSLHNMIANPPLQHHHHHHNHSHNRDTSPAASSYSHRPAARQRQSSSASSTHRPSHHQPSFTEKPAEQLQHPYACTSSTTIDQAAGGAAPGRTASRTRPTQIPSPPSSSSPHPATAEYVQDASMATDIRDPAVAASLNAYAQQQQQPSSSSATTTSTSVAHRPQQPSPTDNFSIPNPAVPAPTSTPSRTIDTSSAAQSQQTVIHVRDLAHIQTLAQSEMLASGGGGVGGVLNDAPLQQMKYDVSAMPIGDIIEMVAALLTKITSTNDLQHDAMQRNVAHQQQAASADHHHAAGSGSGASQINPMSHSVLAFHGKNVPAITIHSYLARIHRYCPTTFEVFLSLLVYFDRMTERVNELVTRSEEARRNATARPPLSRPGTSTAPATPATPATPAVSTPPAETTTTTSQAPADVTMRDDGSDDSDESDSDLADDDDDDEDDEDDDDDDEMEGSGSSTRQNSRVITAPEQLPSINGPSTYFVVDSFNIHRLIIAGVTCSSKFFSDVFYTNSRYAKVGGLPLAELNHLELQFLVLNDFRLAVPVEDLEAYATMLVEFYAREVVSRPAVQA